MNATAARFGTMIARAIVKLVNTTTGCQTLQLEVLGDDPTEPDVEDFQPFGVSFRRKVDDEALVLAPGGDGSHLIAVGSSGRGHRPTLAVEEGEGGLYLNGLYKVFLDKDGGVHLGAFDADKLIALAEKTEQQLSILKSAIESAAVGSSDGGATFKTNITTYLNEHGFAADGSTAADGIFAK